MNRYKLIEIFFTKIFRANKDVNNKMLINEWCIKKY